MKRHQLGTVLAVCGATVCFAIALGMPAAGADVLNLDGSGGANNAANTNSAPTANSTTDGNADACLRVLSSTPCASNGSSSTSTGTPASSTPVPVATVDGTVNGTANGNGANGNANVNAKANLGTNAAVAGSSTGSADCAPGVTANVDANDSSGPLSGDHSLFLGGGLASSLAAGGMIVRRKLAS